MRPTQSEVQFTLQDSIKVHDKGGEVGYSELLLKAPAGGDQAVLAVIIKQQLTNAMLEIEQKILPSLGNTDTEQENVNELSAEEKGEQVFQTLMLSSLDMKKFLEQFKGLMLSGCCKVVELGNKAIRDHQYNQISFDDLQRLIGIYITVFLARSLAANAS